MLGIIMIALILFSLRRPLFWGGFGFPFFGGWYRRPPMRPRPPMGGGPMDGMHGGPGMSGRMGGPGR